MGFGSRTRGGDAATRFASSIVKLFIVLIGLYASLQAIPALAAGDSDLSVTKVGPASVAPNNNMTCTITWTNSGPADATNVTMTDTAVHDV